MYRMANFFISKNLDKAEKMPNYKQWKVSESDRCIEGPILLYIRSKGWFFDRVCQPGIRYCVLTKRGFLLIYMQNEKGFVLDMRNSVEIKSISENVTVFKSKYRRCRIKVHFTFGTVNIILTNGKVDLWRDALLNATAAPSTVAITRQLSLPPMDPEYVQSARPASSMYGPAAEVSPSLVGLKSFSATHSEDSNWAKVKSPAVTPSDSSVVTAVDVSTCDDDYQCLSARLAPIEEEFSVAETSTSGLFNYDSIRESKIPVGWLRRQLEHKIDVARRQPVYVAPPTIPLHKSASPNLSEPSLPTLSPAPDLPLLPLGVTVARAGETKSKKQVKFARKPRSPVKASARSVPSDSSTCDNTRFNSFQFWRSSFFESDV